MSEVLCLGNLFQCINSLLRHYNELYRSNIISLMELLSLLNHNFHTSTKNAVIWLSLMVLLLNQVIKYQEQCLCCLKCLNFYNE